MSRKFMVTVELEIETLDHVITPGEVEAVLSEWLDVATEFQIKLRSGGGPLEVKSFELNVKELEP